MSEVRTWSTTSDNNNSTPPNGWPEGMQYSQVNNAAREMMGALARWRDLVEGMNNGASDPGAIGAYRLWADTGNTLLKQRNAANNGWNTIAPLGSQLAPLASPALSGNPTAPTQAPGDSSTKLATTAFVATSFAPLASPALTGSPTAPTQSASDNSTKLATTAWVRTYAPAGNYVPTISDGSNCFTATPTGIYSRVGNTVTVFINLALQAVVTGPVSFEVSLPIASNITGVAKVIGNGSSLNNLVVSSAYVSGVVANPGRASFLVNLPNTTAGIAQFSFSYEIN